MWTLATAKSAYISVIQQTTIQETINVHGHPPDAAQAPTVVTAEQFMCS